MAMEFVDGVDVAEVVLAAAELGVLLTPRFVATVGKRGRPGASTFAHHAKDANGNPLASSIETSRPTTSWCAETAS